jgi:hypothetical protein
MLGTELSPWSLYKTAHTSSFSATAAIYMRKPTEGDNWFVYWGDSDGNIYQMDGDEAGDPSSSQIETYRRSKFIQLESDYNRIRGRVEYKRISTCDLQMDFEWADDYSLTTNTVPLEGPPASDTTYFGGDAYFGGDFYFNEGFQYSQRVSTKGFSPVGRGQGVYLGLSVQSTQEFDILRIMA